MAQFTDCRRAGLLLHPTSLPGPAWQGQLGAAAYAFIDFLASAGATVWQTLPLCPVDSTGSPYQSSSVFAGEPALIDLETLTAQGLLSAAAVREALVAGCDASQHRRLLERAAAALPQAEEALQAEFARFCQEEASWLEPCALFHALHDQLAAPWWEWPVSLRDREPAALAQAAEEMADELHVQRFEQFVFDAQWRRLKQAANARGVLLFGDMPMFVAHDSADVWANRELFHLDGDGHMTRVAGVPPDYFSADGQLWNMPHYNWPAMASDGYDWWTRRLARQRQWFDLIRIDHFRGFAAAWAVAPAQSTAREGRWEPGPGEAMFRTLAERLGPLPLVAEDLGLITPDVDALRDALDLPGMRVLQFAFDGDARNVHLPHNHVRNAIVYTGTHDNSTALGWWAALEDSDRAQVRDYLGSGDAAMPWLLIRPTLASVAGCAVLPLQDLLGLGDQARLNTPGTAAGNWSWRYPAGALDPALATRLRHLFALYGRLPDTAAPAAAIG